MKQSITLSAIIITTVVNLSPLQAHEGDMNNSVLLNQFYQLDTDADGLVSKSEIDAQPEITRLMEVSTYGSFNRGDFNSNGYLDWLEFQAIEEMLPVE